MALELTQEALARACARWDRVGRLDSPSAWTYRVAINLANSQFRRARYERLARGRAALRLSVEPVPADTIIDQDVRRAVAALPRRQRQAVVLRYLLDLSVDDTAVRMRCATGTVRALTSQGISRLRLSPTLADLREPHDD